MIAKQKSEWKYAPAPEAQKLKLKPVYSSFINGQFIKPAGKRHLIINPADETALTSVTYATTSVLDAAFIAAQNAYRKTWSKLSGLERGKYLYRLAEQLQMHARTFAEAETLNTGKPIRESKNFDIPRSIQHIMYHAGWADKWHHMATLSKRKPFGVVAQIIPWNFPLWMAVWKLAPALACGNTVVIKPAESTPITALLFAELIQSCNFPPGVVNVVLGDGEIGKRMVSHPIPKKIAFTGSTDVGREIQYIAQCSQKALSLELGGKGPHIVFEDAPLSQAMEGIIKGIFFNQGQVCCAGSRLLVHESIASWVTKELQKRISKIRIGHPMDKNTELGPLHSKTQYNRVMQYVHQGKQDGLKCIEHPASLPKRGYYCKPMVFLNIGSTHALIRDEIFGPILTVQTFRSVAEAVQMANNTPFGLSAGVWTTDIALANAMAKQLQCGVVWLNCFNEFDSASPFGGYKQSGFGREGGIQGLAEYLQ